MRFKLALNPSKRVAAVKSYRDEFRAMHPGHTVAFTPTAHSMHERAASDAVLQESNLLYFSSKRLLAQTCGSTSPIAWQHVSMRSKTCLRLLNILSTT